MSGFHTQNGLWFERLPDGSVEVETATAGKQRLDAATWASVLRETGSVAATTPEEFVSEVTHTKLMLAFAEPLIARLADALEAAAAQYGPVTDEQRNEWTALVLDARNGNVHSWTTADHTDAELKAGS